MNGELLHIDRRAKVGLTVLLTIFGVTLFTTHETGRLSPYIQIGIALSLITIAALYLNQNKLVAPVALIAIFHTSFLVYTSQFGASMIGTDTQWITVWTQNVILTGTKASIPSGFYQEAAAFFLLPAITGILTGIEAPLAMSVYAITLGICIPVTVAGITHRVYSDVDTALVAAIIVSAGTSLLKFSSVFIPQIIAVLLIPPAMLAIIYYMRSDGKKPLLILVVLVAALSYSHKLSIFVFMIPMIITAVLVRTSYYFTGERLFDYRFGHATAVLAVTSAIALYLQWEWITGYSRRVVFQASQIGGGLVTVPEKTYSAASPLNGDLYSILAFGAPFVVVLAIGGIAWLSLAISDYRRSESILLLVFCAMTVAWVLLSFFAPLANDRMMFYAEGFLAIVIAAGLIAKRDIRRPVILTMVCLIVVVMVFAPPATHDPENGLRTYLNEPEAQAMDFGHTHAESIHTDRRYAWSAPKSDINSLEEPTEFNIYTDSRGWGVYRPFNESILEGELSSEYQCVSYRQGSNDIHETEGVYVMTWDVLSRFNQEYHRVYSVGETTIHCWV